jgi:Fe2+ transport system protein FeoA
MELLSVPVPSTSPVCPLVNLSRLPCHSDALIHGVDGDIDAQAWLAAVGIARGEHVKVLRRAPFGGPLHIRTGNGGEFAIDATLAQAILVAPGRAAPVDTNDADGTEGRDNWIPAALGPAT